MHSVKIHPTRLNPDKYHRPSILMRIQRHWIQYLFLLPAFLAVLFFNYKPMADGLLLAFKQFQFRKTIWEMKFVGFAYFETFFNNPTALSLIKNTLVISLMKIVLAFPFPIILAILLNELSHRHFKKAVQTISYLPHFLSWTIVATIIERMFAPDTGVVNQFIHLLGGDGSTFWMMESAFFYPIMFFSYVWKSIGWSSIIFLAAITGIDPSLYEVARIDGARKLQEVRYITLPGILPVIAMVFIMSLSSVLSAGYDQIYLLRTAGNMDVADILDTYIIRMGLEKGKYSYATAVGLIQSVAGLLMVLFCNWISRRISETALW